MRKENRKRLSRRDFLKKAAMGTAAMGMGGFMGKTVFAQAKPPIKIGVAISLTGSMAREGELEVGGYKLWGKIMNERGCTFGEVEKLGCPGPGLLGRQVEFVVYDDKSDPSESVKLVRKLIVSDKVDLILGPYGSGASNAIAPLAEDYKIPIITPLANASVIWEGKKREWFVGILPPSWKNLYGCLMIIVNNLSKFT
jgi:branched-chain amino acid transport system substrate-binding protein